MHTGATGVFIIAGILELSWLISGVEIEDITVVTALGLVRRPLLGTLVETSYVLVC